MASPFTVVETPAFSALVADYAKGGHKKFPDDLDWLKGRLAEAPEKMGDHVPGLKKLPLPVFKARCKDTCHRLSASAAWRLVETAVDWRTVFHASADLARKHAAETGCRSLDILHCALAEAAGSSVFLSSDRRQVTLARAQGLRVLAIQGEIAGE